MRDFSRCVTQADSYLGEGGALAFFQSHLLIFGFARSFSPTVVLSALYSVKFGTAWKGFFFAPLLVPQSLPAESMCLRNFLSHCFPTLVLGVVFPALHEDLEERSGRQWGLTVPRAALSNRVATSHM